MLKRVESTVYSRPNTVVFKQEYPITLTLDGLGQIARLNARCLPIACKYNDRELNFRIAVSCLSHELYLSNVTI